MRHTTKALIAVAGLCLLCGVVMIGCGSTQVSASNRRLLAALQTAISAKKPDWLEATAKQLNEKRTAGEVSESEYAVLNAIVAKASKGDWKAAQTDVFALSEGQRPTAQDMAIVRERKSKKDGG